MMTTDIGTNECDLHIVYGKNYIGEEVSPLALAFDNRGRVILDNCWAFVLEQTGGRLTIRMVDSFDSAPRISK